MSKDKWHSPVLTEAEKLTPHWASFRMESILMRWRRGRGYDRQTLLEFAQAASVVFDHVTRVTYGIEYDDIHGVESVPPPQPRLTIGQRLDRFLARVGWDNSNTGE